MAHFRQRAVQSAGALLVLALLLVPLALGGHRHSVNQVGAADACSICVATHHSPAAGTAPLPDAAPDLLGSLVVIPLVTVPESPPPLSHSGRGPPSSHLSVVA